MYRIYSVSTALNYDDAVNMEQLSSSAVSMYCHASAVRRNTFSVFHSNQQLSETFQPDPITITHPVQCSENHVCHEYTPKDLLSHATQQDRRIDDHQNR